MWGKMIKHVQITSQILTHMSFQVNSLGIWFCPKSSTQKSDGLTLFSQNGHVWVSTTFVDKPAWARQKVAITSIVIGSAQLLNV